MNRQHVEVAEPAPREPGQVFNKLFACSEAGAVDPAGAVALRAWSRLYFSGRSGPTPRSLEGCFRQARSLAQRNGKQAQPAKLPFFTAEPSV